jgi:hypothetical protein
MVLMTRPAATGLSTSLPVLLIEDNREMPPHSRTVKDIKDFRFT